MKTKYKTISFNDLIFRAKEYKLGAFNKILSRIIKESGNEEKLNFCLFKFVKKDYKHENSDLILAPEIDCEEPVLPGKTVFYCKSGSNKYQSQVILEPNWENIILQANNAASGDHIFFESLNFEKEEKGVKYFEMWFGS